VTVSYTQPLSSTHVVNNFSSSLALHQPASNNKDPRIPTPSENEIQFMKFSASAFDDEYISHSVSFTDLQPTKSQHPKPKPRPILKKDNHYRKALA
jgi:hypothetical protein